MDNPMIHKLIAFFTLWMATTAFSHADHAHVDVDSAWIRPTVKGQMGTGGFMKLTAREDLRLIRVSTPVAKIAEIHEMRASKVDANVMEMRAVTGVDLAKGKTVVFNPGGYHLMLMELTQVLTVNSTVPVTFYFKNPKGAESKLDLKIHVGRLPSASDAAATHKH
jgi:copper(I)-binding protein